MNRPKAPGTPVGVEAAQALRQAANALKGEAFDQASGRMYYARLASSQAYRQYCGLAAGLQALDPNALQGQAERTAFWLNLYNALMVDAVIQLGVRTSVKAVPGLFWRVPTGLAGCASRSPTSNMASCAPMPGIRLSLEPTLRRAIRGAACAFR